MLLAACLIAKDEERSIVPTITSLSKSCDAVVVLDTGSVDGTIRAAARAGGAVGIQVHVHDHLREGGPFEASGKFHYSRARNAALDAAGRLPDSPKWLLSLSADEQLVHGDKLRDFLQKYDGHDDALLIEVRTPTCAFPYPRLLRAGGNWRYEGQVHEEPRDRRDPEHEAAIKIPGCWIEYKPTDPERSAKRLRETDGPLLREALAVEKDPHKRARLGLLLGQTAEILGMLAHREGRITDATVERFTALAHYKLVEAETGASEREKHFAKFKALDVSQNLDLYVAQEILARLRPVADREPNNPAIAYMVAFHTASVDARAGLRAAQRAALVAEKAVSDPSAPRDPHGLLWRTHLVAAVCAQRLGAGFKKDLQEAVERGLKNDGPQEIFKEFKS